MNDPKWCAQRNLFDYELLLGRVPPGSVNDSSHRIDGDRCRERLARCATDRFITAREVCFEWESDQVLRTWQQLPRDWGTIEVRFQLRVGAPRVVALYGLDMTKHLFHPSLQRNDTVVWAMWCSQHTLYVQMH